MGLARNITELSDALAQGAYRPLPCTRFVVCDPKRRVVHSLRHRDLVVRHALCDNVLAPVIGTRPIYDNATVCSLSLWLRAYVDLELPLVLHGAVAKDEPQVESS